MEDIKIYNEIMQKIDDYLLLNLKNHLIVANQYGSGSMQSKCGTRISRRPRYSSGQSKYGSGRYKPMRSKSSSRNSRKSESKKILPPVSKDKKDSLEKYGYKLSKSRSARRKALKRAARSRKILPVLRRINLISNYMKSKPENHKIIREDVEYMKDLYAKYKIKKNK